MKYTLTLMNTNYPNYWGKNIEIELDLFLELLDIFEFKVKRYLSYKNTLVFYVQHKEPTLKTLKFRLHPIK